MSLAAEPTSKPTSFDVFAIYNGVRKTIEHVHPNEQDSALLRSALQKFDIRDRPHAYALYRLNGEEIPDNKTVQEAGIGPNTELLLREKIVGGG